MTLVLLIGVFQVILGVFRLGWVTRFIPFSVMTGFMTGVAVLIILGQLGDFTGYYSSYSGKIAQLADLVLNTEINRMGNSGYWSVDDRPDLLVGINAAVQVFPDPVSPGGLRYSPYSERCFCDKH